MMTSLNPVSKFKYMLDDFNDLRKGSLISDEIGILTSVYLVRKVAQKIILRRAFLCQGIFEIHLGGSSVKE